MMSAPSGLRGPGGLTGGRAPRRKILILLQNLYLKFEKKDTIPVLGVSENGNLGVLYPRTVLADGLNMNLRIHLRYLLGKTSMQLVIC